MAVVDGGSLGNSSAHAQGFSRYHLATRGGQKKTVRWDLGTATNNEAEYRTLMAALKDLIGRIQRAGKAPS